MGGFPETAGWRRSGKTPLHPQLSHLCPTVILCLSAPPNVEF